MNVDDATTSTGITDLMLIEHEELRTRFANLWGRRDEADVAPQVTAGRVLADLLEVHAKAEQERDVIPDFRIYTGSGLRSELGVRWMTFHENHRGARGRSDDDVDPEAFVRDNS